MSKDSRVKIKHVEKPPAKNEKERMIKPASRDECKWKTFQREDAPAPDDIDN